MRFDEELKNIGLILPTITITYFIGMTYMNILHGL